MGKAIGSDFNWTEVVGSCGLFERFVNKEAQFDIRGNPDYLHEIAGNILIKKWIRGWGSRWTNCGNQRFSI